MPSPPVPRTYCSYSSSTDRTTQGINMITTHHITTIKPIAQPRTAHGVYLYRVDKRAHGHVIVEHAGRVYVHVGDTDRFRELYPHHTRAVYVRVASVLSRDVTNEKQAKTAAKFPNVLSLIHYGAPAGSAGLKIHNCRNATIDCTEWCLNTAGNGSIPQTQFCRIARSRIQAFAPVLFWRMFESELQTWIRFADRESKRLFIRPNGTTDIWNRYLRNLIIKYPEVGWYDYTAVPARLDDVATAQDNSELANYALTFSVKETARNHDCARQALAVGHNLALVCTMPVKRALIGRAYTPATLYHSGNVNRFVDFDTHDLRLPDTDGRGVIGLLTPKGQARGKTAQRIGRPTMVFDTADSICAALELTL